MKYELGQLIFYMRENRVHSAKVLARTYSEVAEDAPIQKCGMFEQDGTWYQTCHGIIAEELCFASREELIASL